MNQLVSFRSAEASPTPAAPGDPAQVRFIKFFTANIHKWNTRRA